MLTIDRLLIAGASLLLVFVNWLAFHDLFEAHTVRDWLLLAGTLLVLLEFARQLLRSHRRSWPGDGAA